MTLTVDSTYLPGVVRGETPGGTDRAVCSGRERELSRMSILEFLVYAAKSKTERWKRLTRFSPRVGGILLGSSVFALGLGLSSAGAEPQATLSLAEVNGEVITAETVQRALGAKLVRLEEQAYNLKREQLDTLIAQRLLAQEAAKRGMSIPALLDAEVTAKVPLVTAVDVEATYQAKKQFFSGDESDIQASLRASLQQEKLIAQRKRFVDSLRSQANIVDRLQSPPIVRVDVSTDGWPVRGDKDALVTIVEFSDFHCPFCKRVQPTLTQLLERYPNKIRLVFRDFPLQSLHPQAKRAAEAARCANDQGKFWEYHDVLFAHAPRGTEEDLKHYAEAVNVDRDKFATCFFQNIHREAVERDVSEGSKLGITGTPTFFINGRLLSGALPIDEFARVIEEEIGRATVAVAEKAKKE